MIEKSFPRLESPTENEIIEEVTYLHTPFSSPFRRAINKKKHEFDMKFERWKANMEDDAIIRGLQNETR